MNQTAPPGPVLLFGSGETAPSGHQAWEHILQRIPPPVSVAVLETPAGFQPNSAWVAEQIAIYLRRHFPHHRPQPEVVPARRKGAPLGPDNPEVLRPLAWAKVLFLGPGSPTYAVRHLRDTLAWAALVQRWRQGAALVFASAAAIAVGRFALPVYEIYKVGTDLHWVDGLDLFAPRRWHPVFIPHWNNREGGAHLDTSRCFMGQMRFAQLLERLPLPRPPVIGIDEHTAILIDWAAGAFEVFGKGKVTLLTPTGHEVSFPRGRHLLAALGVPQSGAWHWPTPDPAVTRLLATRKPVPKPPAEVLRLVAQRQDARRHRDWATADALRKRIHDLGWEVRDTPQGPQLVPREDLRESAPPLGHDASPEAPTKTAPEGE